MADRTTQTVETEWVAFPGGELEGQAPKRLCPACAALQREATSPRAAGQIRAVRRPLCFLCYRADLDRERAFRAAGQIDTGSAARFQGALPFEPVNVPRLEMLRADRARARQADRTGAGAFADRRRQAQIRARHALQAIVAGIRARQLDAPMRERHFAAAVHGAELQLPEAWLPFVVAR
jgi:hypothetical protein